MFEQVAIYIILAVVVLVAVRNYRRDKSAGRDVLGGGGGGDNSRPQKK